MEKWIEITGKVVMPKVFRNRKTGTTMLVMSIEVDKKGDKFSIPCFRLVDDTYTLEDAEAFVRLAQVDDISVDVSGYIKTREVDLAAYTCIEIADMKIIH
jgi:hypothetical protein